MKSKFRTRSSETFKWQGIWLVSQNFPHSDWLYRFSFNKRTRKELSSFVMEIVSFELMWSSQIWWICQLWIASLFCWRIWGWLFEFCAGWEWWELSWWNNTEKFIKTAACIPALLAANLVLVSCLLAEKGHPEPDCFTFKLAYYVWK